MATAHDRDRMTKLVAFLQDRGPTRALEKAETDADKITTHGKALARGRLLTEWGYHALADPFLSKARSLEQDSAEAA